MFEFGQINFLACWVRRMISIFPIRRMMDMIPSLRSITSQRRRRAAVIRRLVARRNRKKLAGASFLPLLDGLSPFHSGPGVSRIGED
ncbi:MAG: hypothetical protein BGO12_20145 [Verrucomicrobia bacterium 61-8]|nr:MAG: hypothetical protein BGO12_20145 [Verrucomicrobia bacterium 61-8]